MLFCRKSMHKYIRVIYMINATHLLLDKENQRDFNSHYLSFAYISRSKRPDTDIMQTVVTRNRQDFEDALHGDVQRLMDVIDKKGAVIRHCYVQNGKGYYIITGQTKKPIYLDSDYHLSWPGKSWSYQAWRNLFFAQHLLTYYLHMVQKELKQAGYDFTMKIRTMYLPWITSDLTCIISQDNVQDPKVIYAEQKNFCINCPDYYEWLICVKDGYMTNLHWYSDGLFNSAWA